MSLLKRNYDTLQQRFPHVATKIQSAQNTKLSESISFKESFERDTEWLNAVDGLLNDCKIIFIYGFGRGLSIADLLELYPNRWLFVYEPDEDLFRKALNDYDLSLLLEHPNFYWLSVGKSQLNMMFHMVCSYMQEEMMFVALREYLDTEMDLLRKVKEEFQEYRRTFFSNKHTENFFKLDWTRNYLYHLPEVLSTPSIEQCYNAFEGVTAVVVSSGPSLQEDIEWLRRIQSHVLIIAAGSSIQALLKNGIRPHLAVIMDGHPVNNKIFSQPGTLDAPLLFTSSSYYEISDQSRAPKIHSVMKSDLITQYFMNIRQEQLFIVPTETVAGTVIQAAVSFGATRIVLAGQDLSFPDDKFYTAGIEHFASDVTQHKVNIAQKQVPNVKGTNNATDDSFLLMKAGLENLIANLPKVEFINTTRNGAVIEGAPFQPIEEVYEMVVNEVIDSNAIAQMIQESTFVQDTEKIMNVKAKMESTLVDLSNVRMEIISLQKLMSKIREMARTKPDRGQKLIEKIEQQWGMIANRDWFSSIFESIMPLEIASFDQHLPTIVTETQLIKKSDLIDEHLGTLLKNMIEQIPTLEEILRESIERMNTIIDVK
ncbi:motility associated factor glycosyltransferase family protein [Paenibacillus sp. CMAA1364]